MRGLVLLLWASAIFILTCTASFTGFLATGEIRFVWDGQPNFSELLSPWPPDLNSSFLFQKSGHVFAFFILTALLQTKFQSKRFILFLAVSYASLTEILQLFFSRDGRLFDIGIDLIGILIALGAGSLITVHQSRQTGL
jgi:VanZ family protein